jgi:hypothetical protein
LNSGPLKNKTPDTKDTKKIKTRKSRRREQKRKEQKKKEERSRVQAMTKWP